MPESVVGFFPEVIHEEHVVEVCGEEGGGFPWVVLKEPEL